MPALALYFMFEGAGHLHVSSYSSSVCHLLQMIASVAQSDSLSMSGYCVSIVSQTQSSLPVTEQASDWSDTNQHFTLLSLSLLLMSEGVPTKPIRGLFVHTNAAMV